MPWVAAPGEARALFWDSGGVSLRYLSASLRRWSAVAGTRVVTSSRAFRRPGWATGRPMQGQWRAPHTVIHRTCSPSHPCGSLMAGVRGCPRGVAPLTPPPARRDHPGVASGRTTTSALPRSSGC